MTLQPQRPPAKCPGRQGTSIDIDAASFTFVAQDRSGGRGRPALTEAFGYFHAPGQAHDVVLRTGSFEVPANSAVAKAARHAAAHFDVQAQIAAILRSNVNCCRCTPADGACPALDTEHLMLAVCRVTRPQPTTEHAAVSSAPGEHPVTADCSLECLAPHLSAYALNPLRRELPLLLRRPATIGDVVYLCQRRQLNYIRHLGPRRTGEIEIILILAGLLAPPLAIPPRQ